MSGERLPGGESAARPGCKPPAPILTPQILRVIQANLAPHGTALISLGSEKSRYGVTHFSRTLAAPGSGLRIEEYTLPEPLLRSRGGEDQDTLLGPTMDQLNIGSAASYRHFLIRRPHSARRAGP